MKYKVGDKVKIIDASQIEPYELGQVGTVKRIEYNIVVDMGRLRRPHINADRETCWWLRPECIEKVNIVGQQLLLFEL